MSDQVKLSKEDVKKIANLAQIQLTDEEVEKFQGELTSILEYVQKIQEADTKNVSYSSHVEMKNVFRKDIPEKSLSQDDATQNRKDTSQDGYFTITSVLNHADNQS